MVWYLGKTIRESFATGEAGETFAALSRKVDGTDTVFTPTFTGSDRAYEATYVPTVTGVHTSAWQGSVSGAVVAFTWDVIPAAADPAAIADAIAGIMDQSSAGYDAGTIGYEIHALFKRPVGSG